MKIEWVSRLSGGTGFSECARNYIKWISRDENISIKGKPIDRVPITDPFVKRYVFGNTFKTQPFRFFEGIPNMFKVDGYVVVFEFDKAPGEWAKNLNQSDIIFSQSDFSIESLSSIVDDEEKMFKMYGPIDVERYSPLGPSYWLATEGRPFNFHFLSVFEWVTRKCPERLIEGFKQAFDKDDDVALLLRTWSGADRNFVKKFNKKVGDSNIFVIKERVKDMARLYRSVDAYVSPTSGEAWGMTLGEAMLSGLPTIGSNHSGNLEFMNKDNSFLVDVRDWEEIGRIGQKIKWLEPDMKWRLPKIDSIAKQMSRVYERYKDMSRIDKLNDRIISNAVNIRKKINPDVILEQFKKGMEYLNG